MEQTYFGTEDALPVITDSIEIVYRVFFFFLRKIIKNYITFKRWISRYFQSCCAPCVQSTQTCALSAGSVLVWYRDFKLKPDPTTVYRDDCVHNIMHHYVRNENYQTYRVTKFENEYLFIAIVMRHVSACLSVPFVHYTVCVYARRRCTALHTRARTHFTRVKIIFSYVLDCT